jgi:hypothetical protein
MAGWQPVHIRNAADMAKDLVPDLVQDLAEIREGD